MKGFTLTELLVAIVILLICATGVFSLMAVGTDKHTRAVDTLNLNAAMRKIVAELQQNLTAVKPRDVRNAKIPGFPERYTYDAKFTPYDRSDATSALFRVEITLRGIMPGETRYEVLLARKLPHRDVQIERPAPAPGDTGPGAARGYDPVVDFLQTAGALPDIEFQPIDESQMIKLFLGMVGPKPDLGNFEWQTALSKRTGKGMAVFLRQPVKGGKTRGEKTFYAMNVTMSFFPSESSGLTNPRAIQLVKRDCWVGGVPSDLNGRPWSVDGPASDIDVTYQNQKMIDRGRLTGVAEKGLMAWDAPGLADPWKTQQNFDLRVVWQFLTWVVCNTPTGGVTPVGYFRWRVVIEGRVGLAPMDTKLDVKMDECAFIESDATEEKGDATILRRFWK